jgi:transposase InsO family protein
VTTPDWPPPRCCPDEAKSYRIGAAWITACSDVAISRRFIQTDRPWTNGKAERFNRTLQTEWAYGRLWTCTSHRTGALDGWLAGWRTTTLPAVTQSSADTHRSVG